MSQQLPCAGKDVCLLGQSLGPVHRFVNLLAQLTTDLKLRANLFRRASVQWSHDVDSDVIWAWRWRCWDAHEHAIQRIQELDYLIYSKKVCFLYIVYTTRGLCKTANAHTTGHYMKMLATLSALPAPLALPSCSRNNTPPPMSDCHMAEILHLWTDYELRCDQAMGIIALPAGGLNIAQTHV
jgi:hypothetical protein